MSASSNPTTPSPPPPAPPSPPVDLWQRATQTLRRLGPAAILAAGSATLPLLGSVVLFRFINDISSFLTNRGPMGMVIYVVGFALFSGMAFLPTYASAVLGGWAFGFKLGLPLAMGGFAGGAVVGYYIARWASKDRVQAIIGEHPKWLAVRNALLGQGFWRSFLIVFLLRLPSSPFAATTLVLASLKVRFWPFLWGTVLGMLPRTSVTVFLASKIEGALNEDVADVAKPWWLVGVGIAITIAVVMTLGVMANRALAHVTGMNATPGSSSPGAGPVRDAA